MLWLNRKQTQSVTFTEDAADQTLLDAIEQELSQAKYQTFSNLCKQALWQFLLLSKSEPTSPPLASETPNPNSPQVLPILPNLQPLEERLFEIKNKLTDLEKKVLADDGTKIEKLETQFHQLTQQVTQLQTSINQKLTEIATGLETVKSQPVIIMESKPPQPEPEPVSQEAMAEVDPLLKRLGSLLDDF
ncbi:hypothetical protein L2E68_02300 [Planktothrix agardhii 1029]|uniref:hypothetical protein n=1 Tax=Planktothrix agardhii TaxID=1160 RepID=UPI001D0B5DEB|nr:hypothetical protein [Planktothrix agardhii]MCB8765964.1 hypothetical protein [Planktothrix agardhii 1809]MCB8784015.1 hypothetical protein [Planktothrix agardhii 1808]MCF3564963.1 hypothetical protein [Planktothrix agardhii 1807]MCF3567061.1 hypothetical protein [Planktothrix agardhii 1807]MCF3588323.1 hypothetical protein [Planktothrix agardhii 1029]